MIFMKLLEYKGKQLLKKVGITVPDSILIKSGADNQKQCQMFLDGRGSVMVKAQVIGGGRKKAGLVLEVKNDEHFLRQVEDLFKKQYHNTPVDTLLIEQKIDAKAEYFLSILYDTVERRPMILFSRHGGIEIENNNDHVITYHPERVGELSKEEALHIDSNDQVADVMVRAYQAFIAFDCSHLEINPLIMGQDGNLYAADAKITIDSAAVARQPMLGDVLESDEKTYLSVREREARKIDEGDHRGVSGKTFIDLPGDIAVLASGGGASLTALDALIESGGSPANYAEYSGNPPREKVRKLTLLTLSKPGLKGCLIIGGTANFTDIFETLSGVVDGMQDLPSLPKYPIVIRRAGPRDKEAFLMFREFAAKNDMNVTLFGQETSMSYAAKVMVDKVIAYKQQQSL